ncbi:MAG: hypothetical protein NZO16_07705 [Deltaproteobacteria bacterium]|nr:hypothetical protein [Deltaproteobacteria bacterium]
MLTSKVTQRYFFELREPLFAKDAGLSRQQIILYARIGVVGNSGNNLAKLELPVATWEILSRERNYFFYESIRAINQAGIKPGEVTKRPTASQIRKLASLIKYAGGLLKHNIPVPCSPDHSNHLAEEVIEQLPSESDL